MVVRKNSIIFAIILCFVTVVYVYHTATLKQVKDDILEHTLVIAEPMWNLDTDRLDKYLETVSEKNNYESLKLIDDAGVIVFETATAVTSILEKSFAALRLIPKKNFVEEISYDGRELGKIEILWRDTSIYFYSYTVLIFLLLIVITQLYSRVFSAKKSLEQKVVEIENTLDILKSQKDYIEEIFNIVPEGLITIDHNQNITGNNHFFEIIIESWAKSLGKDIDAVRDEMLSHLLEQLEDKDNGHYTITIAGQTIHIDYSSSVVSSSDEINRVVSLRDSTKINVMKRELAQTQKLESVGRLASGIAHEINTPTQYVLSNIDFLTESYQEVADVMNEFGLLLEQERNDSVANEQVKKLSQIYQEADWDYLQDEIPKALLQSREGLRRTANIVRAMKHFSHPSGAAPELNDINSALKNTVAVTTNEWKYAADIDFQLDPELPLVPCFLDELNQVFLSMIVNSAHAIEEKHGNDGNQKGNITIKTETVDNYVSVVISDDGVGISKEVKDKVFDPFFTTKELNKGTGQGLAIAYDAVVNRHNGAISVESEENVGTSFIISLPCENLT